MKNSETGEFELVLGNRQLLSGFFVVVILFGVFFTMGYIVGRNSAAPRAAEGTQTAGGAAQQSQARPAAATEQQAAAPQAGSAPAADGTGAAPAGTQPVREPEAAAPPSAAPPAAAEAAPAPLVLPPPDRIVEPAPGEVFLQVMAVKKPEADVVVKTLRDKGFRAVLGQGPNDLLRVLVGPFPDRDTLTQAKAGLENAGFRPIVRK